MGNRQRVRAEVGATMVEFAFVSILLFLLIFGIIGFGVVLSFKQTTTQGANEAARAAAVTPDDPATVGIDERVVAAEDTVERVEAYGRSCTHSAMTCTITVHDCAAGAGLTNNPAVLPDCITVRLDYDYGASPVIPPVPLLAAFMPDRLVSTGTAQLTFPGP